MKEKYKIYIFSVLSHGVTVGVAFLTIYLMQLAWPEFGSRESRSFRLVHSFLIYWSTGFIMFPFFNPYEPSYRYFFKGGGDKKH